MLTFEGTYTQNEGDEAAAGTVTVTHVSGATNNATLDADGAYSLTLNASGGTVTIVEALDGVPVHTFNTGVTEGTTIDTSRDLGRVAFSGQSGASVPESWLSSWGASTLTLTGTAQAFTLTNPASFQVGTDISIEDDDETVTIETAGKYVIEMDVTFNPSADAVGRGWVDLDKSALAENNQLAWGNGGFGSNIDSNAGDGSQTQVQTVRTTPPVYFGAGESFKVRSYARLLTGTATADLLLQVTRVA